MRRRSNWTIVFIVLVCVLMLLYLVVVSEARRKAICQKYGGMIANGQCVTKPTIPKRARP